MRRNQFFTEPITAIAAAALLLAHAASGARTDSPSASANIVLRSNDTADRGCGFALRPADKKIEIRSLSYSSDGNIMKVIVYENALTSEQRNRVGWYLQEKYRFSFGYVDPNPRQGTLFVIT